MTIIHQRLEKAFQLTKDLVESLIESHLKLDIANVPSNSIGSQLWCIIGARQSYLKAIKHGGTWQGFSCSLENKYSKDEILKLLDETMNELKTITVNGKELDILKTAIELLEHEVQHHGQLIRYIYANKLPFPQSWNDRYTV
ncbi:MAG: hypothetical protein QY314_02685 [Candidatus Dojkabacteria bacterium]|nr:MAG: hypothetical protein QY314_02685 [Candidatus Dojkabacteria bacterium]